MGRNFWESVKHAWRTSKTLLARLHDQMPLWWTYTYIVRLIPVSGLDADFQKDIISSIMNSIESCGKVVVVICDDNRVNQAVFQKFETRPNKPWLTVDNIFLLFDYVHLMKNVRNN